MKPDTFFEKFELVADTPDTIRKLRQLILTLAVAGKLVLQDPEEEPADELLARNDERRRFAANSDHRADIDRQPILSADDCWNVPDTWSWRGLADLVLFVDYRGKTPTKIASGVRLLTAKNVRKGEINLSPEEFLSEEDYLTWMTRGFPKVGDVLFTTEAPMGNAAVVRLNEPFALAQRVICFHVFGALDPDFLTLQILSDAFQCILDKNGTGVTAKGIKASKLKQLPIAVPPLAEQKRIVAKVDELMALCNRLEAQQQERETRQAELARASLARFAEAPTPANLQFLFHTSYTVSPADLRKSILSLAVQGKLVPQDREDKPASNLIAQIEESRERLAKLQGVRSPKNIPRIAAERCPHLIPETWQWEHLGRLALAIDYGTSEKACSDWSKIPVYRMGNIVGGRLLGSNLKYVDASIGDLPALYLKNDDILFNRTNSYELVGKAAIYKGPDDSATFASYLIRIRLPSSLLLPSFFNLALNSPYFRKTQIEPEIIQQCGQANFNGTKLSTTAVPVPPLAEQRRIVAKVDQLMTLVDELESQIATSRTAGEQLMEAVVAHLAAPGSSIRSAA